MRADLMRTLAALVDLVLPADCAGCHLPAGPDRPVGGAACAACLAVLRERPAAVRPTPAPPGLPRCFAAGPYGDVRRELILGYKERGRRQLAGPLGAALGDVVRYGLAGRSSAVLVPVPTTTAARRERHGDHMRRLARHASRHLRAAGVSATVVSGLAARPRPDSAGLDRSQRAYQAWAAFVARPARMAALRRLDPRHTAVVVVDDILTTGATLSAVTARLVEHGVPVAFASVLAATRLRGSGGAASPAIHG